MNGRVEAKGAAEFSPKRLTLTVYAGLEGSAWTGGDAASRMVKTVLGRGQSIM
jgi:hypothetical protein